MNTTNTPPKPKFPPWVKTRRDETAFLIQYALVHYGDNVSLRDFFKEIGYTYYAYWRPLARCNGVLSKKLALALEHKLGRDLICHEWLCEE